ncbi:hypothetical protein EVAR_29277_1 [Eumeta japonica]|uniref:Uncharacterized protein n=1 Tax=Eumeta variegata TaxID=151549 RepID=A0A4C1VX14_EUMVA|nr:hypothetical protein EVAR_29277_1 [Eumeta japonica]
MSGGGNGDLLAYIIKISLVNSNFSKLRVSGLTLDAKDVTTLKYASVSNFSALSKCNRRVKQNGVLMSSIKQKVSKHMQRRAEVGGRKRRPPPAARPRDPRPPEMQPTLNF